jgi:hypothetical protein
VTRLTFTASISAESRTKAAGRLTWFAPARLVRVAANDLQASVLTRREVVLFLSRRGRHSSCRKIREWVGSENAPAWRPDVKRGGATGVGVPELSRRTKFKSHQCGMVIGIPLAASSNKPDGIGRHKTECCTREGKRMKRAEHAVSDVAQSAPSLLPTAMHCHAPRDSHAQPTLVARLLRAGRSEIRDALNTR